MSDDDSDQDLDIGRTISDEVIHNPEGYGIDDDFIPMAVFDSGKEDTVDKDQTSQLSQDHVSLLTKTEEIKLLPEVKQTKQKRDSEEEEEDDDEVQDESEQQREEESLTEEGEVSSEENEEEGKDEGQEEEEEEEERAYEKMSQAPPETGNPPEKEIIKFEEKEGETKVDEMDDVVKDLKKRRMSRRMSKRMSMFVRKKSIFYQKFSRFRDDSERISGDFKAIGDELFADASHSIDSFQQDSDESFEEEEIEEEKIDINRNYYYGIYGDVLPKRNYQKIKNNFLHKKTADYFKRRKMEHVLKDTDNQVDTMPKYHRKLEQLDELIEQDVRKRSTINADLEDLESQKTEVLDMLNAKIKEFIDREKEIGLGLINTKTGKELPVKVMERYLKRQRFKVEEISTMRVAYIKIRNKVAEKKEALRALETVGKNLHLIDYEQLKIEKNLHIEKIEEREGDMSKAREKCREAIQHLAHVREKSAACIVDTASLKDRLEDLKNDCFDARERLNYFKKERESYRAETLKLQEQAGILGKPKLCADMEDSIKAVENLSQKLENLKKENTDIKTSQKAIKWNIDKILSSKAKNLKKSTNAPKDKVKRFYKGRPTLEILQLPESDWSLSISK